VRDNAGAEQTHADLTALWTRGAPLPSLYRCAATNSQIQVTWT
jgi:hypothetical protein